MNQYTSEHIGKCAGCPNLNGCPLLHVSFRFRTLYCEKLQEFKADAINEARANCSPQARAFYDRSMASLERLKRACRLQPIIEPYLLREMPASQLN